MLCTKKNSFLQLHGALKPRLLNKMVNRAVRKKPIVSLEELPPAPRLESLQPSIYGYWLDVSEAVLGFGRNGLRVINRDLHSEDSLIQMQAVYTMLNQIPKTENATFLLNLNVVYRLLDLMDHYHPLVRETVLLILTHLAGYLQGRSQMVSRLFIDRLIIRFMKDRKEIRYAASLLLKTLTRYKVACTAISGHDKIAESLIKMAKNDHMMIVIFHLNTLKNLSRIDPVKSLKANAFLMTKSLMIYHQYKIVQAAMDCMTELCKHEVGKILADKHDMNKFIQSYLVSPNIEVIISAVGLMCYTTLTSESLQRVKEFQCDLTSRLMALCAAHNKPVLQLRALQILINLCASPDIKAYIKGRFKQKIKQKVAIRTNEIWDGTKEITTFGLRTGLNPRTMCIETAEIIEANVGYNKDSVKVECYLSNVQKVKERLMETINM